MISFYCALPRLLSCSSALISSSNIFDKIVLNCIIDVMTQGCAVLWSGAFKTKLSVLWSRQGLLSFHAHLAWGRGYLYFRVLPYRLSIRPLCLTKTEELLNIY